MGESVRCAVIVYVVESRPLKTLHILVLRKILYLIFRSFYLPTAGRISGSSISAISWFSRLTLLILSFSVTK